MGEGKCIGKEPRFSAQKRRKPLEYAREQIKRRGTMERTEKAIEVYQLRIWIWKISPQIWRRLEKKAGIEAVG